MCSLFNSWTSVQDPKYFSKKVKYLVNCCPRKSIFLKALYTFDIGQNDLTAGYKLNLTTEQVKAYVPDVLCQLSHTNKIVYKQGGISFWIHNTGPLGCLPYILDRFLINPAQIDKYGCADQFNKVAQYFNQRLKEDLLHLRKDVALAAITYVDVYSAKRTLITQAKKYGLENPLIACCGHGGKYNYNRYAKRGTKKTINGNETVIAKSCERSHGSDQLGRDPLHRCYEHVDIPTNCEWRPPNPLKMACRGSRMDH